MAEAEKTIPPVKSQPIITPGKFLGRDAFPPPMAGSSLAVVAFCPFYAMKDKIRAEALSESLFSHLDQTHQYVGHVSGRTIVALECLYGGPLSATVIEELAHYGVKRVMGYGYAGSLTRAIPVGQIVLAEEGFVSDGTSREYTSDAESSGSVLPDGRLAATLRDCASGLAVDVRGAKVWTTDAIYREYPEKIAAWRNAGAEIVNMDTSHFYAVSRMAGLSAAYACVISDCVEGPEWEDGFRRVREAMGRLQDVIVSALADLAAEA